MKESEKKTEAYLVRRVKQMGGWCIKLLPFEQNGLPDRICLFPGGRIIFVETKSQGDNPRKLQIYVMRRLIKLGFKAYVADTKEKIDQILNEIGN